MGCVSPSSRSMTVMVKGRYLYIFARPFLRSFLARYSVVGMSGLPVFVTTYTILAHSFLLFAYAFLLRKQGSLLLQVVHFPNVIVRFYGFPMPYTLLLPSEMFNARPQCMELVKHSRVPILF